MIIRVLLLFALLPAIDKRYGRAGVNAGLWFALTLLIKSIASRYFGKTGEITVVVLGALLSAAICYVRPRRQEN